MENGLEQYELKVDPDQNFGQIFIYIDSHMALEKVY